MMPALRNCSALSPLCPSGQGKEKTPPLPPPPRHGLYFTVRGSTVRLLRHLQTQFPQSHAAVPLLFYFISLACGHVPGTTDTSYNLFRMADFYYHTLQVVRSMAAARFGTTSTLRMSTFSDPCCKSHPGGPPAFNPYGRGACLKGGYVAFPSRKRKRDDARDHS